MKKRIMSLLLVICMVTALLPLGVLAADEEGTLGNPWTSGSVNVYKDGSTLHVYSNGEMVDYASVEDTPWYEIGGQIDTVVIESGVAKLGANAFRFGSITNVRVKRTMASASLGMGDNAIPVGAKVALELSGTGDMPDYDSNQPWANLKNNITTVTIAEGVGSIGAQAFSGCIYIQSVVIPGSVAKIGQQAFANCTALTDVTLRHNFANGLTIGTGAFPTGNAGFKIAMEITGSAAVPSYADRADQPWAAIRESIKTLTIGGDVAGIGDNAFAGCTKIGNVTMYFNEKSGKATKALGVDWFREHDEAAPINVVAVSADKAFKNWSNATFGDEKNTNTVYYYNREKVTIEANWDVVAPEITVKPAETKDYGRVAPGYEPLDPHVVTVKNVGNEVSGKLLVELSGGNTSAFTLSTKYIDSLAVAGTATFTVTPKTGLGAGYYTTKVVVSDENGTIAEFLVALTVSTTVSRAEEVVKDFYKYILNRTNEAKIDDEEVAKWVDALAKGGTVAQVASSFYSSKEFSDLKMTDEQFITSLYRALLGRGADAEGMEYWKKQLTTEGKSRSWVLSQFCNSAEFKNRMAHYELVAGTVAPGKENGGTVAVNIEGTKAKEFATRLYKNVLGREPDEAGLVDWSTQLINKTSSGAVVAAGFFGSVEYVSQQKSNRDFIADLYYTMLAREPGSAIEDSGMEHWLGWLAKGKTRAWVYSQFCISQEFKNLCNSYGIISGSVDPTKYNMGKNDTNALVKVGDTTAKTFVKSIYTELLKRPAGKIEDSEINQWAELLSSGKANAASVAASIAGSAEFRNLNLTDEAYVKALFKALLGREASAKDVQNHVKLLTGGATRSELFGYITKSEEYQIRCNKLGLSAGTINPNGYNMGTYTKK